MAVKGANNAGHQLSMQTGCEHRLLNVWHLKPHEHLNKSEYLFPLIQGSCYKGDKSSRWQTLNSRISVHVYHVLCGLEREASFSK